MVRIVAVILLVTACAVPASAQHTADSWKVGVGAGAGIPASLAAIRFSAPETPHSGFDLVLARVGSVGSTHLGPACIAQVRWMRGGRAPSGYSRHWIFGVMAMRATSSTLVIFPGNQRVETIDEDVIVMPRVGYGWDRTTRRGTRLGLELTTGSAGESAGLMLANAFVAWGPK
jgi:hypothetical protein